MIKLKFIVNKEYTFLNAFNCAQKDVPFKKWESFTLNLWDKYPNECYLLAGFSEWSILNKSLKSLSQKAEKLLEQWLKKPEAKKLIKETEEYCNRLQKEWEKKETKILNELKNIIKTLLPNKQILVYVTHPKLKNGLTVDKNIIAWGHKEEWPNYSMIYLCHEILHTLFWDDKSNITHAVIELATDQELRLRLNKRGRYFQYKTHKHLSDLEKKILPDWKKYLKNPKKNIRQFIKEQKEKRPVK